jgi:hypothetical protein
MSPVDVPLHPVIVTARPQPDHLGFPQPLPEGAQPGSLRIVRADQVQPGDHYLSDCEQRAGGPLYFGVHTYVCFPAAPRRTWTGRGNQRRLVVAVDGESFVWRPDELVMVVPRTLTASAGPAARCRAHVPLVTSG